MNSDPGIESATPAPFRGASSWTRLVAGAAIFLVTGSVACFGASSAPDSAALHDSHARAERIEELQDTIARDRAILEQRITQPRTAEEEALHLDPEIHAIAARLTDQRNELEALEAVQRSSKRATDASKAQDASGPSDESNR